MWSIIGYHRHERGLSWCFGRWRFPGETKQKTWRPYNDNEILIEKALLGSMLENWDPAIWQMINLSVIFI